MHNLDEDFTAGLFDVAEGPCLSLYQPTHRHIAENQQDTIRYGNLLRTLEESLRKLYPERDFKSVLDPFRQLEKDRELWNHALDGLVVLGSKDLFRVYTLQRSVPELAVVADSFHIKPLLRILQSADRYQVLGVSRKDFTLFEGNRDRLDEIKPVDGAPRTISDMLGEEGGDHQPYLSVTSHGGVGQGSSPMHHGHGGKESEVDQETERFFRAVDRQIIEHHSRPSGLPLILAALPEHHHMFREISDNPFLIDGALDVHPDSLDSIDEVQSRIWELIEPHYLARLAALVEAYGNGRSNGLSDDDLAAVAKAIATGRVETALIEADRQIPGRVDTTTGEIDYDDLAHPEVDDVLDDLAALTLKMGGKVVIVPTERMPTSTGVAAIYRY